MPLIEIESDSLTRLNAFPLSFTVKEGLSSDPQYSLEFQAPDADIDLDQLLGESLTIPIEQADGDRRHFYAYVVACHDEGQREDHFVYRLELRTWLWFLMQNRNCRIFQDLNIIEIIEQVFARYGLADYRLDIEGRYMAREYCVQFGETDFTFINRLMEDEGIWYYFVHERNKHTLVITDRQSFPLLDEDYAKLPFLPDGEESRAIREGIQRIQRSHRVHPREVVLRDFDYHNPRNPLQTQVEESRGRLSNIPLEWYDYAAGYADTQRGEFLARLRLEMMQSDGQLLNGESNAVGLKPGHSFELFQHPAGKRNRGFKLIRCDYVFLQDGPDSASEGRNVACRFIALNDDITYRPLRLTPRPQVSGIQSATVVGPKESEVHTDELARIRVHFHWDRYKTTEEDSSCWIRVVQAWAGKGWGVLAMPRVGQEVLITYVDGDLDRPLVTGIVYNGDNPPPYRLPEHINYSGLVSRSMRFGNPMHASQITFDDNRGNERVMLHAERDLQNTVERNEATSVGQDLYEEVKRTVTDWCANHVSYTDYQFSITGFSVDFTGVSTSFTGISTSFTGIDTSFYGMSSSFYALYYSFYGVSTSMTGVGTSFTGLSTSITGQDNSITGCSNSFVGTSNSVVNSSHSFVNYSSSVEGTSISHVGCSTSIVGSSTSFTGSSVDTTGSSVSTTGSSVSITGSSVSTTGSSVSTTGSSVDTTGSSISTTGSSISTTGSSISTTGSSISTTGLSISYVGAEYSQVGIDLKTVGLQSKN